jgi:AraC-like DNA-binding protein
MSTAGADFPIHRISTDEIAVADRLAAVRDAYRGTFGEIEIAPHPESPFYWHGVLRRLPGLWLASAVSSGARVTRVPRASDADDLVLTVAVEGRLELRQGGQEAILRAGEMAVTRSREPSTCERDPHARSIDLHVPLHIIAPTGRELDAILVAAIAAPEPLAMLRRYVDGLLDSFGLEQADTLNLAVAHVYETVSYIIGAARARVEAEKARGPAAARLRAIKADIVENVCSRELTIVSVAARHQVTPRYVRKLFEGEGVTFSEFVLAQRLARARRMLADLRHGAETISAIAFACGFGDLSYFNRVFRRQFAATPTAVREAARCGAGAASDAGAGGNAAAECSAVGDRA